jgi:RNA polymerase-binding transcription factor DksA
MHEHLTDEQLRTLERRLAAREKELRAEVRSAKQAAAERPSAQGPQVEDDVEAGEQRLRRGMEHVDLQRDQEELRAIEAARERIASGRYGECVDCGRPIPFERLQVQPVAQRCVEDQAKWEKTHPSAPLFSV